MCYKQLRRYSFFFIVCFFLCTFLVFRQLELNERNSLVENVTFNRLYDINNNQQFLRDKTSYCGLSLSFISNDTEYPECSDRLQWLYANWRLHKCYAQFGVNGTDCSFYNYMARQEQYCRVPENWPKDLREYKKSCVQFPDSTRLEQLFALMNDSQENYEFIKMRISRMWARWLEARDELIHLRKKVASRSAKNIFFYLGFLNTERNKLHFAKASRQGGPLGELVQWSDLIASIYALGHNLQIYTTWNSAKVALLQYQKLATPCPKNGFVSINLIFIDIMGLQKIKKQLKSFYVENWCRFRVLDSFGTHAEFNQPQYFRANYKKYGTRFKSNPWGGNALNLQQFLTLYPHTDDNTFLGFVVEMPSLSANVKRENITVVYAKEAYMWENSSTILKVASRYTQIHATVEDYKSASEFAHLKFTNHGVLSAYDFNKLLQRAKVFLGLGFPLEGPAPLEAIANGAVFIQPRFKPPKSRVTYKFFSEKPTMRKITSQNPYMEHFVGAPSVLTVNMKNMNELICAYEQALQFNSTMTLPYEFTFLGMLERVDVILTHLNFCAKNSYWPPYERIGQVLLGREGQSCEKVCSANNLLCERSFFKRINNQETLSRYGCNLTTTVAEPYAPHMCSVQNDPYLFSCATEPPKNVQRLCPCRRFKKHQTILYDGF